MSLVHKLAILNLRLVLETRVHRMRFPIEISNIINKNSNCLRESTVGREAGLDASIPTNCAIGPKNNLDYLEIFN